VIIELSENISPTEKKALLRRLNGYGCETVDLPFDGAERIGVLGKPNCEENEIRDLPGVRKIVRVTTPHKLASRQMYPADTRVRVGDAVVGGENIAIIAGPCAVESLEQVMTIAQAVKKAGAVIFRGGAFKPRTSPYSFQGLEEDGLKILAEVRDKVGLPVVTEMTSPSQADLMEKYVDMVQVGARNMQNYELLKCVGRMKKPVLLKRGLSGTIEEWLMSAEYILAQGNRQVVLCERGIRTFEPYTRNTLDLSAIPVLRNLTHLPVIVDPSHATGMREKVSPMARAAIAAGADGLMIEVHHDPDHALSDGPQSLFPEQFAQVMRDIYVIAPVIGKRLDFSYLDRIKAVDRRTAARGDIQRAAFVGRTGTSSHKACVQYFGDKVEAVPMPSFTAIFEGVKDGHVNFGVIPLENSLTGSIHENYDHLQAYNLKIVGELKLRIIQNLMVKSGAKIGSVRRVLSHPQVFEQCRRYLQQHDWEQVAVSDTADAAERVSRSHDIGDAAIANLMASEIYELEVIAQGIETDPRNYTRFVVVAAEAIEKHEVTKSSLILTARNEPGALFEILQILAQNRINMIKLESRPIPGEPWKYMFYIDLEADIDSESLAPVKAKLKEKTEFLKILGTY
jgi:3-deoxy-7-phosphoheptulonate synthase